MKQHPARLVWAKFLRFWKDPSPRAGAAPRCRPALEPLEERAAPTDLFGPVKNLVNPVVAPAGVGGGDGLTWSKPADFSPTLTPDVSPDLGKSAAPVADGGGGGG